jgi:hypothetical protein
VFPLSIPCPHEQQGLCQDSEGSHAYAILQINTLILFIFIYILFSGPGSILKGNNGKMANE